MSILRYYQCDLCKDRHPQEGSPRIIGVMKFEGKLTHFASPDTAYIHVCQRCVDDLIRIQKEIAPK